MSYQQVIIEDARNNDIRIQHPDLPRYPQTVAQSSSAGATTQTVGDNLGFANTDYVVLGESGQDKTELVTINGAVTRGTSLSTTATSFDHPQDCPVQKSIWNQIEISGASTVTGSKTVITTIDIQWAMPVSEYVVTGTTYNYYFCRFKNSGSSTFSSYSDAAPAAGYNADTVRAVKVTALNLTGEVVSDGVITDDFLNTEITNVEIDIWKEKRRWAQFYVNDYVLGTLTAGITDYALPTDISDPDTNSAIRGVRIRQIGDLTYIEEEARAGLLWDTALSTLASQAVATDTSITLVSVADFTDSGSLLVGSDSVTYTARNTSTNVLSGIPATGDGSITATWAAGTNVWQGGEVENSPTVYTIIPGTLSLVLPPSATYQGQAIYLSYYSKPTYPNSDADTVNWPDPLLYHYWLAWKISLRLHDGSPTDKAANFERKYLERKNVLLSRARLQDSPKFFPKRNAPTRRQLSQAPDDMLVPWIIGS